MPQPAGPLDVSSSSSPRELTLRTGYLQSSPDLVLMLQHNVGAEEEEEEEVLITLSPTGGVLGISRGMYCMLLVFSHTISRMCTYLEARILPSKKEWLC